MAYSLLDDAASVNQPFLISHDDEPSAQPSLLDKKAEFNILEKLKHLRDSRKFCDVVLEVRGVKFVAHKNVLASWSPTFAAKLFADDPNVFKDYIVVYYDNCEVFSDLLDFMYNGYVAPRETNFLQLLHLAVSFQIETLKNYCEEFLRCNLHLGNFVSTYFLSRKFKLETLEEYIVGFLQLNLSDTVKQGEFLSLRAEKFNTFLSEGWMKKIKPEIKLFLIISWVGYDVQEREKYLVHLLGHINWSTVANDFLLEINRTENFFTSHESSLYLLLQTLYSAGIPLGPYQEAFPALRKSHCGILKEVVHTCLLTVDTEEFCPVRIDVLPRPVYRDAAENTNISSVNVSFRDTAVNTDVNSKHFEETVEDNNQANDQPKEPVIEKQKPQDIKYDQFETLGEFIEAEIYEIKQRENQKRLTEELEAGCDDSVKASHETTALPATQNFTPPAQKKRAKRNSSGSPADKGKATPSRVLESVQVVTPTKHSQRIQEKELRKVKLNEGEEKMNDCENVTEENMSDNEFECEEKDQNKAIADKIKTGGVKRSRKTRDKDKEAGVSMLCKYEDCAYITKYQQRMDKHLKMVHEATFELKCNMCEFETKEVRKYNAHMKQHFPGPPFKCDYPRCTFSAEKIKPLLSHRFSHTDERPFTCECGMRFRTNNTLIAHKKVHLGKKEFTCTECGVSFATRNTLNQHKVIHSDHRPYLCHLCGFTTKFQSHLISHKKIHTGEVFYCQFPKCKYSSPKRSQLKAHMRAHLGVRTHVCEVCSKSFVERSHLIRHQKLHNDERLQCNECEYTTTRKDKLKDHIKKHHSGLTPSKTKKSSTARGKRQKNLNAEHTNENEESLPELPAPMIVKWDHGSYSLSQENQDPVTQNSGDGLLNNSGDYCVLRSSLNSNEQIPHMLAVEQINIQMTSAKSLDSSANAPPNGGILQENVTVDVPLSHSSTDSGINTAVPVLSLLSSPLGTVDPAAAASKLDTSEAGQHAYAIIQTTQSDDAQQQEFGGLNAFMAFI